MYTKAQRLRLALGHCTCTRCLDARPERFRDLEIQRANMRTWDSCAVLGIDYDETVVDVLRELLAA